MGPHLNLNLNILNLQHSFWQVIQEVTNQYHSIWMKLRRTQSGIYVNKYNSVPYGLNRNGKSSIWIVIRSGL